MTCPRVESSRGRDSLFEADNQPGRDLRVDSELEGLPLPYFICLRETRCSSCRRILSALKKDVRSVGRPEVTHMIKLKSND
jgi:ferredoxin